MSSAQFPVVSFFPSGRGLRQERPTLLRTLDRWCVFCRRETCLSVGFTCEERSLVSKATNCLFRKPAAHQALLTSPSPAPRLLRASSAPFLSVRRSGHHPLGNDHVPVHQVLPAHQLPPRGSPGQVTAFRKQGTGTVRDSRRTNSETSPGISVRSSSAKKMHPFFSSGRFPSFLPDVSISDRTSTGELELLPAVSKEPDGVTCTPGHQPPGVALTSGPPSAFWVVALQRHTQVTGHGIVHLKPYVILATTAIPSKLN